MNRTMMALAFLIPSSLWANGQDSLARPVEVLQLKDGAMIIGHVVNLDKHALEIQLRGQEKRLRISTSDVMPYSLYKLKLVRIDKKNAQERLVLAKYCVENKLYSTALREYAKAVELDGTILKQVAPLREHAYETAGRLLYQQALRHQKESRVREAYLLFLQVVRKYPESRHARDATLRADRIAEQYPGVLDRSTPGDNRKEY